jgi:spermidine synthase
MVTAFATTTTTTLSSSSSNKKAITTATPPAGIRQGWFTETEALWPGQKFSLALDEFSNKSILFQTESDFQSVLVFRSAQYGNVLVLDGVIQLTERDEFSYHEMMTHIPLCSHPHPARILIVGGGDGGILREVCRHDTVSEICVVEIDATVVAVAREFFKNSTAVCLDDPRVRLVHQDAAEFMADTANADYWDVIIGDTSDAVGPAESLFQPAFYECMYQNLRPSGIICMQGECFWIHLQLIADLTECCRDIFDSAEYCSTMVPTYPCGQIGFILATKNLATGTCRKPVRRPAFVDNLQWYSPAMHRAAFTLPPFVLKELEQNYTGRPVDGVDDNDDDDDEEVYTCFLGNAPPCSIL